MLPTPASMTVMTPYDSLTGENRTGKEAAGNISTVEADTGIEVEQGKQGEETRRRYVPEHRSWQHTHIRRTHR